MQLLRCALFPSRSVRQTLFTSFTLQQQQLYKYIGRLYKIYTMQTTLTTTQPTRKHDTRDSNGNNHHWRWIRTKSEIRFARREPRTKQEAIHDPRATTRRPPSPARHHQHQPQQIKVKVSNAHSAHERDTSHTHTHSPNQQANSYHHICNKSTIIQSMLKRNDM